MELLMFAKHLKRTGDLPLDEAGDLVYELGFDGIDLTVRPGGYIPPEEVQSKLPAAIDLIESKGLSVPMITTAITDVDSPHVENIFQTATECDIQHMKLGYWRYPEYGTMTERISDMQEDLLGIKELSERYGVKPSVHIHSGDFITANPAILWYVLQEFDKDLLGAYLDPGHMKVEGGVSGWKQGIDLLGKRTEIVSVKDYEWYQSENDEAEWKHQKVPLKDGIVRWPAVFEYLSQEGFDGPLSVHSEYDYSFDELIEQTRVDLAYLEDIL